MAVSSFIGRVGGLAASLGVGVAIVTGGVGPAWGQPTDNESIGGADSAVEPGAPGSSRNPAQRRERATPTPPRSAVGARRSAQSDDTNPSDPDEPQSRAASVAPDLSQHEPGQSRDNTQPAAAVATVADSASFAALAASPAEAAPPSPIDTLPLVVDAAAGISDPPLAPLTVPSGSELPRTSAPDALAVPDINAAVPSAASDTAVTADRILPQSLSGVLQSVARLLSGGGPLGPAAAPAMWVLAAAARQEIGTPEAATAAPAATVSTGAPPAPAPVAAVPLPAASGPAKGTATVIQTVNVRPSPIASGTPIAQYTRGMTFNYDSYTDANGYRWLSYISGSGARRYVAQQTLDGKTVYVTGGVPIAAPPPPPPPPPTQTAGLRWPLSSVKFTPGRSFGVNGHNGIDLVASAGTPVYSAGDGVVSFEGNGSKHSWMTSAAGICVLVWHPSLNIYTGYAHLSRTTINNGQSVAKGQLIGYSGYTGNVIPSGAKGAHLHFEVLPKTPNFKNGYSGRINPAPYIR